MSIAFVLLGLAICAAWLPPIQRIDGWVIAPWAILFIASVLCGLVGGTIRWAGALALAAVWGLSAASVVIKQRVAAIGLSIFAVLLAFVMAVHLLPGFVELPLADGLRLGPHSPPIAPRANFDTASAGLLLLVHFCRRAKHADEWRRGLVTGLALGAVTTAVVVGLVFAFGAIAWEAKLPAFSAVWLPVNLLFTCVAEEALFRGVIQERLSRLASVGRSAPWIALGMSSLLFGLAHGRGGPALIAAATLAGIGYGTAYLITRRIEAPILAHFTLNATHFLGFTFPYYVR